MQIPLKGGLDGNFIEGGLDAIVKFKKRQNPFFHCKTKCKFKAVGQCKRYMEKSSTSHPQDPLAQLDTSLRHQLEKVLDVPIGIVVTAWGSSTAEAWSDVKTLHDLGITIPNEIAEVPQITPTVLYNAMMHPLIGYGIKGVLWYQGEENRS